MTRLDVERNVPLEIQDIVEPIVREFIWLCPLWLQTLCIGFVGDDQEYVLQMTTHTDYRYARMMTTSAILKFELWERREMVIHEMIHCFTTPLSAVAKDAINDLDADPKLKAIIIRRINEVSESITQDFAYCIAQQFPMRDQRSTQDTTDMTVAPSPTQRGQEDNDIK